jgi:ribose 5-phosphate isomerase B
VRVAIGSDHGGYELKRALAKWLRKAEYDVLDLGAHEYVATDDYPDYSLAVARAVAEGRAERGLLVCGSGVGACVAANKVPGVRGALAHDSYSARQGVEHDDVNVLCLGARVVGPELARELVTRFLEASFTGEERHVRRLKKVMEIEERYANRQESSEK